MKAVVVFFFLCLTVSIIQAQTDLQAAIGKGDIAGISAFLGDKVDLTIGDTEEVLSKPEAEVRLREFYAVHLAKGYRSMHAGTSKNTESTYTIGELTTDKGPYRVYLYFAQAGQKRVIEELRIEKE